jgi:hypothetical protein
LLGPDIRNVIFIDNSQKCFCLHPENGILIPSFFKGHDFAFIQVALMVERLAIQAGSVLPHDPVLKRFAETLLSRSNPWPAEGRHSNVNPLLQADVLNKFVYEQVPPKNKDALLCMLLQDKLDLAEDGGELDPRLAALLDKFEAAKQVSFCKIEKCVH